MGEKTNKASSWGMIYMRNLQEEEIWGRPNQHAFIAHPCVSKTAQVFPEEHNYIYGHLGYCPLTEPYLVEEGYAFTAKGKNTKQYETNCDQMPGRQTPSKIEPDKIITPDTEELLTSPD
eukprot:1975881-Ditylum_brightwellii.AAC.2